jgi:hypothetical protein
VTAFEIALLALDLAAIVGITALLVDIGCGDEAA